jgi:hypothetical protein
MAGGNKFIQGKYLPVNKNKYIGAKYPTYRSSYELKFFKWCDENPNIVSWASECLVVPYISPIDNKVHRYYTDATLTLKSKDKLIRYIVEIKPYAQTQPPKISNKKKSSTFIYEKTQYEINRAKWSAAKNWCSNNNYRFIIITEKNLITI